MTEKDTRVVFDEEIFDQSEAGSKDASAVCSVSYHVTKFCHQASARRVLVQDLKVVFADAKSTEPETTVCYLKATSAALMKGTVFTALLLTL